MQKNRIADLVVGADLQYKRSFKQTRPYCVAVDVEDGFDALSASKDDGVSIEELRVNGALEK